MLWCGLSRPSVIAISVRSCVLQCCVHQGKCAIEKNDALRKIVKIALRHALLEDLVNMFLTVLQCSCRLSGAARKDFMVV